MYGRFLKEAAGFTDDERLGNMSEEFRAIGDQWQRVAQTLQEAYRATSSSTLITEASRLILDIADREQTTWEELHRIVVGPRRAKI